MQKLWSSSYYCLTSGLAQFEATGNIANQALLYANLGSLMRSCAEAYGSLLSTRHSEEGEEEEEVVGQERQYYQQAISYYTKGKEVLHRRSTHPHIWHSLDCDLSAVYYALGRVVQEHPLLSSSLEEVS